VTNEGKASQEQHRRHIRGGKDTIEPDAFGGAFDKSLSVAEEHGALDSYNEGPHDSGRHDSAASGLSFIFTCKSQLKHNFGHEKDRASEMYCLLNLLAFLWCGIPLLLDGD